MIESLRQSFPFFRNVANFLPLIIEQKVVKIAGRCLGFLRPFYASGMGVWEFTHDGLYLHKATKKEMLGQEDKKIKTAGLRVLAHYCDNANFHIRRGFVAIGLGIIGSVNMVERMAMSTQGSMGMASQGQIVATTWLRAAIGLTFFSHLLTLNHSIRKYQFAKKLLETSSSPEERLVAMRARQSAVLGIVSSLSYLILGALCCLESLTATAFVFACLSVITGFVNAYFDYLYVQPPTLPPTPIEPKKIYTHPKSRIGFYA